VCLTALNSCAALGQSKDVESRDQSLSVEAFRCPDAERRTTGLSKKISNFSFSITNFYSLMYGNTVLYEAINSASSFRGSQGLYNVTPLKAELQRVETFQLSFKISHIVC